MAFTPQIVSFSNQCSHSRFGLVAALAAGLGLQVCGALAAADEDGLPQAGHRLAPHAVQRPVHVRVQAAPAAAEEVVQRLQPLPPVRGRVHQVHVANQG